MSEPLKPCPHCEGKAELIRPASGARPYVMCVTNYCTAPKDTEAEAVAAWNRRATLIREAKTQLVALVGVTATRDTATGEPLMWGDKDGDCLSPEIALQERVAALIREAEARGMERAAALSCSCSYDVLDNVTFEEGQMFRAGAETALDAVSAMLRAEAAAIRGEGK